MNTVTITEVDPSKCTTKQVGFITEPVLTEEVIQEARKKIHKEVELGVSLDGATVIVSGTVYPPSKHLITSTQQLLSEAYYAVEESHAREAAAHKNLVETYAKAYGLPIFEG